MKTGLVLSVIGAALLLAGPLGSRVGLWSFVIGFLLLALSLLLGLVGASLSLVAGFKTGQWQMAVAGIVIGLAVVSVPSAFIMSGVGKPPIHDITTDTVNPPPFVAILPLRAGAANPPEYGGSEVADHLFVRHHTAVELADRTQELGLVKRQRDRDDHRVVRLTLTPAGRRDARRGAPGMCARSRRAAPSPRR